MPTRGPHRRHFLKAVGAAVAPALAGAPVSADDEPPVPTAAQALTDLVRARFGRHLSAAQLRSAQGEVDRIVRMADMLRRMPLDDADEPVTVFVAEPPE